MMGAPILTTARLELVPWRRGDLDSLHALWTDPDVRRYLFDDIEISRDQAAEIVEAAIECWRRTQLCEWTVRAQESPTTIIGFAGLRWLDEATRQPELMYGVAPSHWGRGLATEAALAVLEDGFARLGFDRIWASADAPNLASFKVMQRLGMTRTECPLAAAGLVSYRIQRDEFRAEL